MRVRIKTNTRIDHIFYGRDSILDVGPDKAQQLVSIGIGEIVEPTVAPEKPEAAEPKPKAKSSRKSVKK